MLNRPLRACVTSFALMGCGGGQPSEPSPGPLLTTYRFCRFEFVQGGTGLGPSHYDYRCVLVSRADQCDMTEPCTPLVTPFFPECVPGRTTCTPCGTNQITC